MLSSGPSLCTLGQQPSVSLLLDCGQWLERGGFSDVFFITSCRLEDGWGEGVHCWWAEGPILVYKCSSLPFCLHPLRSRSCLPESSVLINQQTLAAPAGTKWGRLISTEWHSYNTFFFETNAMLQSSCLWGGCLQNWYGQRNSCKRSRGNHVNRKEDQQAWTDEWTEERFRATGAQAVCWLLCSSEPLVGIQHLFLLCILEYRASFSMD